MKKVLLVVAALALVISGVNAVDVKGGAPEVTVSVSGSAKVQFGINLNDQEGAAGFANSSTASAAITILPATPATSKGEEETYATITVADVKVAGSNGAVSVTAGSVSAKIVMGALYINILGVDNKIDRAAKITTVVDGDGDSISIDNNGEFKGLEIGYAVDGVATFSVGLTSNKDWVSAGAGNNNAATPVIIKTGKTADNPKMAKGWYYDVVNGWFDDTNLVAYSDGDGDDTKLVALGLTGEAYYYFIADTQVGANDKNDAGIYNLYLAVGIKAVENLTANVYANGKTNGFWESSDAGIGFDAAYTVALSDTMKLIPSVASDIKLTGATSTNKDLKIGTEGVFGVALSMPGSGLTIKHDDKSVAVASGLTVKARLVTDDIKNASSGSTLVAFAEGDLLPIVDLALFAEYSGKPGNDADVAIGLGVSATIDQIKPYANLTMKDTDALTLFEASDDVRAIVGVTVTPIQLLSLNLEWASKDLTYSDSKSFATDVLGTVILTAEIKL